ncbi:MAG: rhombosortase [Gammaproteobacteria bacterium]
MFGLFTPRWTRSEIAFSAGFVALLLLLGAAGEPLRDLLRFDRAAIGAGEWWRLLSCHFVHLGAGHLWLDTLGLALLLLFFRDVFSPRDWAITVLAGVVAVGVALWLRDPQLSRYVGISGVLHTMLFAGLLLSFRYNPVINGVVFAAMAGRLWTEQQPGYDVYYLADSIGGAVMVNAHLYGALASLPVVLLLWRSSQARQRQFRGLTTVTE